MQINNSVRRSRRLLHNTRERKGNKVDIRRAVVTTTNVHAESCIRKYVISVCTLHEAWEIPRTSMALLLKARMQWRRRLVRSTAVSATAKALRTALDGDFRNDSVCSTMNDTLLPTQPAVTRNVPTVRKIILRTYSAYSISGVVVWKRIESQVRLDGILPAYSTVQIVFAIIPLTDTRPHTLTKTSS